MKNGVGEIWSGRHEVIGDNSYHELVVQGNESDVRSHVSKYLGVQFNSFGEVVDVSLVHLIREKYYMADSTDLWVAKFKTVNYGYASDYITFENETFASYYAVDVLNWCLLDVSSKTEKLIPIIVNSNPEIVSFWEMKNVNFPNSIYFLNK